MGRFSESVTLGSVSGNMRSIGRQRVLYAVFGGQVAEKTRSRLYKRTRGRFAIFAGCGIISPTSFQSCKGGDMVCARGPLGACVAVCHNVDDREGPLRILAAVPLCYGSNALKSFDLRNKQLG
jgi:hypothetical protein